MASVRIRERATVRGEPRFQVVYRLGGRATRLQSAGTFLTQQAAEKRVDDLRVRIAGGEPPKRPLHGRTKSRVVTSVYVARTGHGDVLYVGITGKGIRRAHRHAAASVWWPLVQSLEVEHFKSRREAEARERELIAHHAPYFNIVYRAGAA